MSGFGLALSPKNFRRRGTSVSQATNTVAPSITGTRGGTLTATNGTWTGATSLAGQWYADGIATGNTTTSFVDSDVTKTLEYRVTAQPGNVVASAYEGVQDSGVLYSEDFNAYADGTRLAARYNTTDPNTFAATASPHITGWDQIGYIPNGDTEGTGEAQMLRVESGRLTQVQNSGSNGNATVRDFGTASLFMEYVLRWDAPVVSDGDGRTFIFCAEATSTGEVLPNGIYVAAAGRWNYQLSLSTVPASAAATITGVNWADGDTLRVQLDAVAKRIYFFRNDAPVGDPAGYDLSAWTGNWTTKHGFQTVIAPNAKPVAGQYLVDSITADSLTSNSVVAAINDQPSGSPGKKQVDITATIGVAGATGAQYKIETAAGEFVTGWTALNYASGSGTGTFIIPDFAYEGQQLKVLVRDVGGPGKIASHLTAAVPYALQQSMRIAMNDSDLQYWQSQIPSRDIFMPFTIAGGATAFLVPPPGAGNAYHDAGVLQLGEGIDNYGHWAENYSPTQLYPDADGSANYIKCIYNGVQWQRTVSVARSGVAPDPTDPDGTVSGWKRTGYCLGSVIGMQANGWPSKLPDDPNLTISYALPMRWPANRTYPITVHCKTVAGVHFIARNGASLTETGQDTFDLTLPTDGEVASIVIDRTRAASIDSSFFISGIPSYEAGAPAADIGAPYVSSDKIADLTPFYGVRRMKGAPIERFGAGGLYDFTAANVEADGSNPLWRYDVDIANQMNLKVLRVHVPDMADDAWVTSMATYYKNRLNPTTELQVGFSNEDWNDGYKNANDLQTEAQSLGISRQQLFGRKTAHMASLWRSVWGSSPKLKIVAEWQMVAALTDWQAILDFENAYQSIDLIGGALYFPSIIGPYNSTPAAAQTAVANNDYAAFEAAVDAAMRTGADDLIDTYLKPLFDWIPAYSVSKGLDKNKIGVTSYEGGFNIVNISAGANGSDWDANLGAGMDARARSFFAQYARSAAAGATMGYFLDQIATKAPHLFFMFIYVEQSGGPQDFGMMDRSRAVTQQPMATVLAKAAVYNA